MVPIDAGPQQVAGLSEPLKEPMRSIAILSGWKDSKDTIESIEKNLQEMGSLGWELVSFLPDLPSTKRGIETPADPRKYHAVFKRPAKD